MSQQSVELPYHWDRHNKGMPGEATFELSFALPEAPREPFGLYVPRLGNAYEVWLNGTLLQRNGDLKQGNGDDFAKAPRYMFIEPGLLRPINLVRIQIRADVGRRGGLAALVLGPEKQVHSLYLVDYRWRILGSMVVVVCSLLIGLLALTLWATQIETPQPGLFRRDALYLFAAVSELFWVFSIGDALIESPFLPWPWWGIAALVSGSFWVHGTTLFCVEVAAWGEKLAVVWLRRWIVCLLVASVIAGVASMVFGLPLAMTLLYATSAFTSAVFGVLFILKAVRGASMAHKLVAFALVLNVLVAMRDIYVFRLSQAYGGNTLIRFSSILFGFALLYIVIHRFREASKQVRDAAVNMAARVTAREVELAQSYQQLEQFARDQERNFERNRILRDMHDGVGAHITTAIRQLESGQASQVEVLHTLRDSLDQLKLSIDAMNLPPGDITALLANLRYRLEPRLKTSGLALHWDVDLLAPLERLDDKAMRHLQYMVFEAVSNVLQHANASKIWIVLRPASNGGAQLLVIDNGCGLIPGMALLSGLGSLRERAALINASLSIASAQGKTQVEILLN